MAMSFGQLKAVVIRLLSDEIDATNTDVIAGMTTSADLLKDAVRTSLRAILPWIWKTAVLTIADDATELELPSDAYRIEGVFDDALDSYLNEDLISAGTLRASESGNMWIEYPEGYLTFTAELTEGGTLYYAAYWTEPELDSDIIEAPSVALAGIAFYAASYCLLKESISSARLRQYNVKVDSGVPTDNPVMEMSNAFMKRFELEMSRISSRSKGVR